MISPCNPEVASSSLAEGKSFLSRYILLQYHDIEAICGKVMPFKGERDTRTPSLLRPHKYRVSLPSHDIDDIRSSSGHQHEDKRSPEASVAGPMLMPEQWDYMVVSKMNQGL